MSWLVPKRAREATSSQLAASGSYDSLDGEAGWTRLGSSSREVPGYTLERARALSVHAYRANPMARAIIDTYTSFCVGDSGLTLQCAHPDVQVVAEDWWNDPANHFAEQDLMLRSALLNGERVDEMMVGATTGIVQRSIIDPTRIEGVSVRGGNPLWPEAIHLRRPDGDPLAKSVITVDPLTGRLQGEVGFLAWFRALDTDRRGFPFLGPILDWLDSFDNVLMNLVDRTALGRYMVWDVQVEGDQKAVDNFIKERKGTHAPKSGAVEVHNDKITWTPKTADVGAYEDKTTAGALMTNVAAGAGLAKTWLAEPEDANRATSLTMGEPVRRRVGGVQNAYLAYVATLGRYNIDAAVRAGRLPAELTVQTPAGPRQMPASACFTIRGPEIADEPAKVGAEVLVNLSKALVELERGGLLSHEASQQVAQKGWEDYMGVPWRPELAGPEVEPDEVADHIDEQGRRGPVLDLVG